MLTSFIQLFQKSPSLQQNTTSPESDLFEWNIAPEGELLIDMYERSDAIIIRSIVAGIDPDQLDISVHNDMLTIRGVRKEHEEAYDDQYYVKECYWGSFQRTVVIPVPVHTDKIRAFFKHGIVVIELPKIEERTELVRDDDGSEYDEF
jgi:HSP20 family protein